ncbi:MAG: threonine/serine exporter family protein [Bacillota bacterium]|nr:threonine/serine exporter family protein [Bacillota bacterium]
MDVNKVLQISCEAGRIILENGGETYRVEETIIRICKAFKVDDADCFVTPTGIVISCRDLDGRNFSIVKRIKKRTVNLGKISKVNDISRRVHNENLNIDFVEDELKKIDSYVSYNKKICVVCSSFVAASFTLIYGGNISDFIVSFFIGGIIQLTLYLLKKLNSNIFFINVLGGIIASFFALLSVHFGLASHLDKIIIGSIMLLVPGIAITNAIRDSIAGDLLSGLSRGLEAFLIAIAIAIGSGSMIKIWTAFMGG